MILLTSTRPNGVWDNEYIIEWEKNVKVNTLDIGNGECNLNNRKMET